MDLSDFRPVPLQLVCVAVALLFIPLLSTGGAVKSSIAETIAGGKQAVSVDFASAAFLAAAFYILYAMAAISARKRLAFKDRLNSVCDQLDRANTAEEKEKIIAENPGFPLYKKPGR